VPYEFRAAEESDFPAICKLIKGREELLWVYPAARYPLTVEQLHELAKQRRELTVVVSGKSIAGFADFYELQPGCSVFIGNVIIGRKLRGKGLGEALIRTMIGKAFDEYALPEVRISVFSDNRPALLLYMKLGFIPYAIDERRKADGQKLALLHMRLTRQGRS